MIDFLDELRRERGDKALHYTVVDVYEIFNRELHCENDIAARLNSKPTSHQKNSAKTQVLEHPDTYALEEIESLCTKYRLRFLPSHLFKGNIPVEAIQQIKHIEKTEQIRFEQFYIAAPAERFALKDSTKDPLLFAQTTNGNFLFIHQWGQELPSWKRWALYPFRSFQTLVTSVILLGVVITVLTPSSWLGANTQMSLPLLFLLKGMTFFTISGFLFFATLTFGILTGKDFSNDVWNDQYIK